MDLATLRLCLSVLLVVGSFGVPAAAHAAINRTVTACSNDTQLRSHLQAIQNAGGGTLGFACQRNPATIILSGGELYINAPTTINGASKVTISGNNASRLFLIAAGGALTLNDITLTNGSSTGDGGAIFNSGALKLNRSKILNSAAAWSGGAIVSYGRLDIVSSEIAYNVAQNGGGVYPRWGNAVTTIVGSSLHHNDVSAVGIGGAMLLWDGASATITNTTIADNKARSGGGGVYVTGNSSLKVNGSTLVRNTTRFNGGAIKFDAASSGQITNSRILSNESLEHGGGINSRGSIQIADTSITGNKATYEGGGISQLVGSLTLDRVTLSGNSGRRGGAIDVNSTSLTARNVTLSGNTAGGSGGGVHATRSDVSLTNVTFYGNAAPDGWGGAIYQWSDAAGDEIRLKNTLLMAGATGGLCTIEFSSKSSIVSDGYNIASDSSCRPYFRATGDLIDTDPSLGPLANNGGWTSTHLPKPGSRAINHGSACPPVDQRNVSRPRGAACDGGAVEVIAIGCAATPGAPALLSPAGGATVTPRSVPLTWRQGSCAEFHRVEVRLGSSAGKVVDQKTVFGASYTTVALKRGKTYVWRVSACNAVGCRATSWRSFKVR